jgi:putative colanic acid biosynthesis UDP-glucose lipid carrier transferase
MFGKHYLKTYQGLFLRAFKVLDLLLVAISTYFFVFLLMPEGTASGMVLLSAFIAAQSYLLLADRTHIYRPWRGKRLRHELLLVVFLSVTTQVVALAALIVAGVFIDSADTTMILLEWFLLQTGLLVLLRVLIRGTLKVIRRKGFNIRRVAFVGLNDQVFGFLKDLQSHPEFGIECVGYIDERGSHRDEMPVEIPHLGKASELPALIDRHSVDQVWFAYPISAAMRTAAGIDTLKHSTVAIRQILDNDAEPAQITGILGMPLIDIDVNMTDGVLGGLFKSVIDKVFAATVLLLLSPLLLLIAAGVKLSSPGPVFYKQTRVTWKNEPFEIMKFRSMPVNAEFDGGESWASHHKTTTRFGEFIRATSLDELPQFINVLRGEMSIIGPRPERPRYVEQFKDEIPSYMKKHRVKAGITGWAQVHGLRGDTDLNDRIKHDLYYIKNWSPMLDVEIALRTVFNGLFKKHS